MGGVFSTHVTDEQFTYISGMSILSGEPTWSVWERMEGRYKIGTYRCPVALLWLRTRLMARFCEHVNEIFTSVRGYPSDLIEEFCLFLVIHTTFCLKQLRRCSITRY
jgi:hypothetical protein